MIDLCWKPESVADVPLMALRLTGAAHRVVTIGEGITEAGYLRLMGVIAGTRAY